MGFVYTRICETCKQEARLTTPWELEEVPVNCFGCRLASTIKVGA